MTLSLILIDLMFIRSSPSPPYQANSIRQVCQIFDISPTDSLCVNASEQKWYTLEAALKRRFSIGQATFSQIMNNLEVTYTDFSKDPKKFGTFDAIAATFVRFAGANCPDTEVYQDFYTCYIYFKQDIRPIRVTLESDTDLVIDIGVGHTGTWTCNILHTFKTRWLETRFAKTHLLKAPSTSLIAYGFFHSALRTFHH